MDDQVKFAHCFEFTTFTRPTKCAVCNKLLLGILKQGLKCKTCELPVHKKCKNMCSDDENISCGAVVHSMSKKKKNFSQRTDIAAHQKLRLHISNTSEHAFHLKTFSKPTYCQVCKEIIMGIYKQGNECSRCRVVCHRRCKENLVRASKCASQKNDSVTSLSRNDGNVFEIIEEKLEVFQEKLIDADIELNRKILEYNINLQKSLEKIENDGLARAMVKGIKAGTKSLSKRISNIAEIVEEHFSEGNNVAVDVDFQEALGSISKGTNIIRGAAGSVADVLADARIQGQVYIKETDVYKSAVTEIEHNTDPRFCEAITDTLKGVSHVIDETYSSINTIGGSVGASSVRISRHLYGDDVGEAAENVTQAFGNIYQSYSSISKATSIMNHARKTFTIEDTTLEVSMYASVFEVLDMHLLIKLPLEDAGDESIHVVVESKNRGVRLLGSSARNYTQSLNDEYEGFGMDTLDSTEMEIGFNAEGFKDTKSPLESQFVIGDKPQDVIKTKTVMEEHSFSTTHGDWKLTSL